MLIRCSEFRTNPILPHLPAHHVRFSKSVCLSCSIAQNFLAGKQKRRTPYVYRNIEERSYNHCCSRRAMSVTYSKYVSVALVVQHVKRVRRIVICGLFGLTAFFHIFSRHDFREKNIAEHKMCGFDLLYNFRLKHFSF